MLYLIVMHSQMYVIVRNMVISDWQNIAEQVHVQNEFETFILFHLTGFDASFFHIASSIPEVKFNRSALHLAYLPLTEKHYKNLSHEYKIYIIPTQNYFLIYKVHVSSKLR